MKTLKEIIQSFVSNNSILTLFSQNYIIVNHNGTLSLYSDMQTAVDSAQSGDHIYEPGGSYNFGSILINKKLTIIG